MTLRKGHGTGAGVPRVEVLPADELPQSATAIVPGRDARGRITSSEMARAMGRMPKRRDMVPPKIACDERFAKHDRRRREWMTQRRREIVEATGGMSSGVGALIAHAGWAHAAAEFANERAAETGDVEGFKAAAQLSAVARGHDLAAWELAVREGKARETAKPSDLPWVKS